LFGQLTGPFANSIIPFKISFSWKPPVRFSIKAASPTVHCKSKVQFVETFHTCKKLSTRVKSLQSCERLPRGSRFFLSTFLLRNAPAGNRQLVAEDLM
jgi:hypothetical protein